MHDSAHEDIPISDRTLDALRTTAAMVLAVPSLAATIRIGGDILLEVRRPPFPEDSSHRIVPPCGFHGAVAGAHRLRRSGERVGMRGVPGSVEPSIDWGVSAPGRILPGQMVRVEHSDRWLHAVPVVVEEHAVLTVLDRGEHAFASLGCHADQDLGVVILHDVTAQGEDASVAAVDRLVSAVGAIGIADLERRLDAADVDASGRT